jgi:proteic killer suppression protein
MIRSILGTPTRRFVEGEKSVFSGRDEKLARRRLAQVDAATSLESFGRLNSVGLHKLTGDLRGFWSVDISGRWQLLFKFRDGDAYEVYMADTHRRRR